MLLKPIRWAFSAATTLALLYVFFFVPLGTRTLYDHVKRIAATREAQELGRDVSGAGERVVTKARDELGQHDFALPSAAPATPRPRAPRPSTPAPPPR